MHGLMLSFHGMRRRYDDSADKWQSLQEPQFAWKWLLTPRAPSALPQSMRLCVERRSPSGRYQVGDVRPVTQTKF